MDLQPASSSIVHQEFRSCNVDGESLQTMIRACKCLKTLIIDKCHIKTAELQMALNEANRTLKALWIGHCPPWSDSNSPLNFEEDFHARRQFAPLDLGSFVNLRYLQVSAPYLVTQSHLPLHGESGLTEDANISRDQLWPEYGSSSGVGFAKLATRLPRNLITLHVNRCYSHEYDVSLELDELLHDGAAPRLKEIIVELTAPIIKLRDRTRVRFETVVQRAEKLDTRFHVKVSPHHLMNSAPVLPWTASNYPHSITGGQEWGYDPKRPNPCAAERRHRECLHPLHMGHMPQT